ncbi:SDR family NAD(P)-dependent oxidoreductase [Longispora albida]|uniref:SDR family NAD(P)-dependent oxidoreductase n=1 Tax=Longispora albida TaxID=203523 RepID=UPI0003621162|nr:SDR family oxidoreductase [Longispora albida]
MTDQVTVVTGGSRGIGAAIVRRLTAEGHAVAIGYASDQAAAERLRAEVGEAGGRCVTVQGDTTVEGDVARLFEAAATLGPVTGLVNNAGITGKLGALAGQPVADIRRVIEVNVFGYLLCSQYAARVLPAGGAIVNISSAAATLGSPGEYVHYAASKAAVDAMTIGLSKELGPAGIRVNAVAPGTIYTDMHAAMGDPARPDRIGATTPLGRSGQPEEIAGAVAWLLGPDASYTTGTVLRVAGGR